jgi:hypothetical protein
LPIENWKARLNPGEFDDTIGEIDYGLRRRFGTPGGSSASEKPRQPKRGKGHYVEDSLKQLMHDLGNAINDSLSESDRIAEAIGEIRKTGFDVFLVLEATIGFNRRDDSDSSVSADPDNERRVSAGKIKFTSQDERFLKALKISVEQ